MKVPEPKRLPSGNWFIRMRLGGVSVPITAPSKKECIRIAELEKTQYRAITGKIKKPPKEMTLREAMKRYINEYKSELSPPTVKAYLSYAEHRFKGYIDKPLGDIKWQQMIDAELKEASEKTVKNAWGLVRPSLKFVGYPTPDVKLAQVPVNERPFLLPDEIKPFCKALKGRPYEIAALLELHGLRLSEMKALTWDDIDLKHKVIYVRGAYVNGVDGYVDKDANKNATSTRPVPIMIPQLVKALNDVPNKSGRVVTTHPSVLYEDVKRVCKIAGVTSCGNHDLRRSFASLCFYMGIPERQIMEWGGWKDRETLHRVYIRLSAAMENENKKTFEGFFR